MNRSFIQLSQISLKRFCMQPYVSFATKSYRRPHARSRSSSHKKGGPKRKVRLGSSRTSSFSLNTSSTEPQTIGPFGLKRVDYTQPPPHWPIPPHPPVRSDNPTRRFLPLFTAGLAVAFFTWVYFNSDNDVYEYWRQVEQGNVPIEYDGDDDDDDDDDEIDLEEDEWEEKK